LSAPTHRCYDPCFLKARNMNTPRHSIARSALGAAWSLALGMVGVAGKRQAGNGPAPI